jgi:hypothetical protein
MTKSERIQALKNLGYSEEESRFLSVASLHSGFFLRRQFLTFVHGTKGWRDVALLEKLEAQGHVRVLVFRHERRVYHLCSKSLYAALGEPNNRNRRAHQPTTIKNKIMALDFVLEHPEDRFLATERKKLAYFVETRQLAREDLPTKLYASPHGHPATAKHFVEGYPIFLVSGSQGASVPHFCYIDEGLQSTDRFATFLAQYRRLLRALGDFRVTYVAEEARLFASAERVFQKFEGSLGALPGALGSGEGQLFAYFKRRRAYEDRDFSNFDTATLIRFREEKKQFAAERYEVLYAKWCARQPAGSACPSLRHPSRLESDLETGDAIQSTVGTPFKTHILDYDYDLFGTLTTKNHKRTNA